MPPGVPDAPEMSLVRLPPLPKPVSSVPSELTWAMAKSRSGPINAEPLRTILPFGRTAMPNAESSPLPKSIVRCPNPLLKLVSRVPFELSRITAKSSSPPMRAVPPTTIWPFASATMPYAVSLLRLAGDVPLKS